MSDWDGDGIAPDICTETNPVARKRHQCCECMGWIEPGERYQSVAGLWDGSWLTYRTCPDCADIRNHFRAFGPWYYGSLRDDLFEARPRSNALVLRFLESRERRGGKPNAEIK